VTSCGGGLTGESRLLDFGRYFISGLVGEKEIEEGNVSRGLRRGAGGWDRRTAPRRSRGVPVSKRACGKAKNKGEKGR
jgi:hypothetical protein